MDPSDAVPTAGNLILQPDGQVERRLTFAGSEGSYQFVTTGRYRVRNAVLEIGFRLDGAEDGDLIYRPAGYHADYITLTYGRPAGGETVEVYQRATISAQ